MDWSLTDREETPALIAEEKLTLIQVQELALLTTKLFYANKNELTDLIGVQDRLDLVAKLSRKLISIHPNCSTAIRYLAHCLRQGVPILEEDLEGTKYQDYQPDTIEPNLLAAELYRKIITINPRDSEAIYELAFLMTQGIPHEPNDLLGTSLEGDSTEYDKLEYAAALSRKALNLYSKGRDLIYNKAYYQLMFFLHDRMSFEQGDLKGTQYEGQALETLDPQDLLCELFSNMHPLNEWDSLSEALARWQDILETPIDFVEFDLMRASIINYDREADYEEFAQAVLDFQIKKYLESEYIKQDRVLMVAKDLIVTALCLYDDSKVPITDRLLKDTKWAGLPPERVKRNDLVAEYCRTVLRFDPKNVPAIRLLSLCIMEGVPLEVSDLSGTIFAKTLPRRSMLNRVVSELYKKMTAYDQKIKDTFNFFLPLEGEAPEALEIPETPEASEAPETPEALASEVSGELVPSEQRGYCPQFSLSCIREEEIEPECDPPKLSQKKSPVKLRKGRLKTQ